jgi:hypothetical protein
VIKDHLPGSAQTLARQAPGSSLDCRPLMIATKNKQNKKITKHYTK